MYLSRMQYAVVWVFSSSVVSGMFCLLGLNWHFPLIAFEKKDFFFKQHPTAMQSSTALNVKFNLEWVLSMINICL